MSKICKKRVHGNDKKHLPWDFKKCPGSIHFTLLYVTLKLTKLLALTSATRASEIHLSGMRFSVKYSKGNAFQFGKNIDLLKNNHINLHLNKISWKKLQLLFSFIEHHEAISTSKISRCIMEVLVLSGIDTKISYLILRDQLQVLKLGHLEFQLGKFSKWVTGQMLLLLKVVLLYPK